MTGFREQGSGTPLTLLHGISSGAASWHKQMALPGYRVLAWDMPGYGESPMLTTARADAGDYADALARMLDRAGVQKTVLVGHSLGALVAAAFAARYPQRVRYLVLADVAQGYGQAAAAQRKKSGRGVSSRWRWAVRRWPWGGRRSCCAPARAKPMWRRLRQACADCAVKAISPPPGCWRTTTSTAGLPIIAAASPCGAASRMLSPSPSWCRGGATLRHAVHRYPAGRARQLSR